MDSHPVGMQRLVENNIAAVRLASGDKRSATKTSAFRRNATTSTEGVAFLRNAKVVVPVHFYRAIHPYGMQNKNALQTMPLNSNKKSFNPTNPSSDNKNNYANINPTTRLIAGTFRH